MSAIGARNHFRVLGAAIAMGGHVRVGLEDNVCATPGRLARTNGEVVEKAVRILRELGAEPASAAQGRDMLKLRRMAL